jgi:hypothetical protein
MCKIAPGPLALAPNVQMHRMLQVQATSPPPSRVHAATAAERMWLLDRQGASLGRKCVLASARAGAENSQTGA